MNLENRQKIAGRNMLLDVVVQPSDIMKWAEQNKLEIETVLASQVLLLIRGLAISGDEVYREIPKEIREEFEHKKVMYVRIYPNIDLPWTELFQTEDKREVAGFCNKHNIEFEKTDDGLRTRQVNEATAIHPLTQDKLWFNQAHLFHSNAKKMICCYWIIYFLLMVANLLKAPEKY